MTLNFPWPLGSICTAESSAKQMGFRQNLADLHMRLFGENFTGAHAASVDCEITRKCFVRLVERGDELI